MKETQVRLIYPPSLVNVPVIHQLIRTFDLTVNIRGAQIKEEQGWLEIQLIGELPVITDALAWLESQGIEVQTIEP
jgi:ABC-type methionine transport system ATPase subunit